MAVTGIAFGAFSAWALGRMMESLQYEVTIADPLTWASVLGVLALTTMAASWRPVRQAMRVDPA